MLVLAFAGGTDEPTVTSSLLTGNEAARDVVVDTLPEKVALDWHSISCSIYKVHNKTCVCCYRFSMLSKLLQTPTHI